MGALVAQGRRVPQVTDATATSLIGATAPGNAARGCNASCSLLWFPTTTGVGNRLSLTSLSRRPGWRSNPRTPGFNRKLVHLSYQGIMRGWWGSNPLPQDLESCGLPSSLHPQDTECGEGWIRTTCVLVGSERFLPSGFSTRVGESAEADAF